MDRKAEKRAEGRFWGYVEGLGSELGHADRIGPLRDYCTGLILPGERKSVEPIGASAAPARTAAHDRACRRLFCGGASPVPATFTLTAGLVGREGAGQFTADGAAFNVSSGNPRIADHFSPR